MARPAAVLSRSALLAVLVVLAAAAWHSFPLQPGQTAGLPVAAAVLAAWLGVVGLGFREERRLLRANPVLLAPLGFQLALFGAVAWSRADPKDSAADSSDPVAGFAWLGFELGLFLLVSAVAAIWTTALILETEPGRRLAPARAWRQARRRLPAALVALTCCLAAFAAFLLLLAWLSHGPDLGVEHASASTGALLISLGTMALLPVVVSGNQGPLAALAEGIDASWRCARRWIGPLLLHWLLLGGVWWLLLPSLNLGPSSLQEGRMAWSIPWLATYPDHSAWYTAAHAVADSDPIPLLHFGMKIPMVLLAVLIKLRVVRVLREAGALPGTRPMQASR